ncbi:MAG: inositol monophosphatase [Prevotellaceae bacterium]|jgi:myo-inositol-1(or 4)-monophosphatase|nr:inositol monophosphatase [Prevotellaceae bacterium]
MVEVKGVHDFVSYVDKAAEKIIVERLQSILPHAAFLTEEQTVEQTDAPLKWIVDPLDGTTNFIHGLYPHSVSIALMQDNSMVVGVVYEIGQDECFYAWKDSDAYLNSKIIRVSNAETLNACLVGVGFPYHDFSKLDKYFNCVRYFAEHAQAMRRTGSAAIDLSYVACGRLDAYFEYSLNPWDVAAGSFILQRTGGRVSDFSGKDSYIFGQEIVATNAKVFSNFIAVIKKNFG